VVTIELNRRLKTAPFGMSMRPAAVRPSFLVFSLFPLPFFFLAGDIGQMNLPVGMQSVNFRYCEGLTGTAESRDE
jgi:hypothetical protein